MKIKSYKPEKSFFKYGNEAKKNYQSLPSERKYVFLCTHMHKFICLCQSK